MTPLLALAEGEPRWVLAAAVTALVLAAAWAAATLARVSLRRRGRPHRAMVVHKVIGYLGTLAALLVLADLLEIDLTHYLAAAGILTVAVGFAAQTSFSNLISGLFLLVDEPFQVGDTVEIEGRTGVVREIRLLSTFVRTFDNILVRWPNEVVLRSTVLNFTRFEARRIGVRVGVAYGADLERAREVVRAAVAAQPGVLLDPEPMAVTRGFLDSAVELEALAWTSRTDFLATRTQVVEAIHAALAEAGIEIPFPQRVVHRPGAAPAPTVDAEATA